MTEDDSVEVLFVTDESKPLPDVLTHSNTRLAIERVDETDTGTTVLDAASTDCLVVDGRLSEHRALALVRRFATTLPVLLYDAPTALLETALEGGAADVVRPADPTRVVANRIRGAVAHHSSTHPATDRYGEWLSTLLEHSTERLSILDSEGNYTYVSPAVERLMGHDPDDLFGESGFDYVHPADRDRVVEAFERLVENPDETVSIQYRIRDSDDTWRWVESRGTNRLADPAIEGIVINSQEVTDRRERQRRLSEERAFTEGVFAALPDVFYAFDGDGNFLRWNDRLSEATGYDDEAIKSMHPTEFVASEDRPAVAEAISQVFEAGTPVTVEARFQTKDGETRPYEFTGAALTRPDGETLGLVGIGRDISDRKRRRRRFEAVFDNTPQFLCLTDLDGTVLEVNETVLEFVGSDREAVVGQALWDTEWFRGTPPAAAAAETGVERARCGDAHDAEIEVCGTLGTETIEFSVRPITDDRGEVTLLVAEGRRITKVKRRERHLEVLHRFLRHNLRNKMTIIQGTANVLDERLSDPTDRDHVTQIMGAATELIDLSETAHQLSRVAIGDDGERQPTDLQETLVAVRDGIEAEYEDATVRLGSGLDRRVRADWRLHPMFEQLVENAVEHGSTSPQPQAPGNAVEHSSTTNRTEPDDAIEHSSTDSQASPDDTAPERADTNAPTVDITCTERDDSIAVRIADNGPGIPQDELVGITTDGEPTQLTHGTGFGLWLVRSVVDDYAGSLDYEPHPEGGSVVIVELPLATGGQRTTEGPADTNT
jgi:PAS domain S-box-containing protein